MMKMKIAKSVKGYRRLTAMACVLCMGLAGCGSETQDTDSMVIVEHEKEDSAYTLVIAGVDDVVKTDTIRCSYKQVNNEELSFSVGGKKIAVVYVENGDEVKAGQLLAELEGVNRQDEIEELEYQIARNELLISYTDIDENYDKSKRWWDYVYKSSQSDEAEESLRESLASIEQSYRYKREDYQDTIELAKLKLEAIKEEVEQGRVYATMDGVISYMKSDLVGAVATAGATIIKISDSSVCQFETTGTKYKEYFESGQVIEMKLGYGKNADQIEIIPYEPENWDSKMFFEVLQTDKTPTIEVGAKGVITLELDRREQVLCIPQTAIHTAEGKEYVYILGENDIRDVRWIETGLHGDNLVEIISGLTEGENVILK